MKHIYFVTSCTCRYGHNSMGHRLCMFSSDCISLSSIERETFALENRDVAMQFIPIQYRYLQSRTIDTNTKTNSKKKEGKVDLKFTISIIIMCIDWMIYILCENPTCRMKIICSRRHVLACTCNNIRSSAFYKPNKISCNILLWLHHFKSMLTRLSFVSSIVSLYTFHPFYSNSHNYVIICLSLCQKHKTIFTARLTGSTHHTADRKIVDLL